MTPEIKAAIEELGRSVEEFKAAHKKEIEEIKAAGTASRDTSEKVEKLNERIAQAESGLEQAKAAMNRSRQDNNSDDADKEAKKYKEEFNRFLRKGDNVSVQAMKDVYKKAYNVAVDEDGGFLVTPEQSAQIVEKIFESSPMRAESSVQTISTDALEILEDLDEVASGWVGETESRSSTDNSSLKMVKIPVHELYAKPKATQKFLDDAAINVEAWLNKKFSDKFGRDEATAFVSGDGVKRPKGILAYASGTGFNQIERITTATQHVLAGDDLMELMYALKDGYMNGAKFAFNRNTEKVIRKLKSTTGAYLWQPGLDGMSGSSILGHQIVKMADLFAFDSVTAVNNANTEQVIFGNFKEGYQIVDRIGIRVLRDPYSAKPFVEFYATKRVGGGVKNFEALKVLKIKA